MAKYKCKICNKQWCTLYDWYCQFWQCGKGSWNCKFSGRAGDKQFGGEVSGIYKKKQGKRKNIIINIFILTIKKIDPRSYRLTDLFFDF